MDAQWFIENEPAKWIRQIRCDCDTAVKVAVAVVDLVLPEWKLNQPDDPIPVRAVDAARKCVSGGNQESRQHARALAKGCGDSRRRSFGDYHLIAEAARAVANAASASTEKAILAAVAEALSKTEKHILYRYSIDAIYGKEAEVRRMMFAQAVAVLES